MRQMNKGSIVVAVLRPRYKLSALLYFYHINWIPEGSHKIGRPRITWNDNIMKDIENSGVTWEEALLLMTDKQE